MSLLMTKKSYLRPSSAKPPFGFQYFEDFKDILLFIFCEATKPLC